jgi:hypothetical protein
LVATGQVRSEPLKRSARDPESVKESAQKNGMVDGLESGCQVKHDQHNDTTTIDCTYNIIMDLNQRRLSRVILPVCGLKLIV